MGPDGLPYEGIPTGVYQYQCHFKQTDYTTYKPDSNGLPNRPPETSVYEVGPYDVSIDTNNPDNSYYGKNSMYIYGHAFVDYDDHPVGLLVTPGHYSAIFAVIDKNNFDKTGNYCYVDARNDPDVFPIQRAYPTYETQPNGDIKTTLSR